MKKLLLLVVLSILAAYGSPAWSVASDSAQLKNVAVTLMLDRDRYEPGEPVQFSFTLVNNSAKPVTYEFGNSPIYQLWVNTPSGTEVWRYKGEPANSRQTLRLQPGEARTYRATWNQSGSHGQLQSGWYEVFCKLSTTDRNIEPLRVKFKIDERLATGPIVILVPVMSGVVSPSTDIGKPISVEGVLRQGAQGLYIDVSRVNVRR